MKPPVLNRKLVLEASVAAPDGAGGQVSNWVALGTLWGALDARTGREASGEAGALSTAVYRITVRAARPGQQRRPTPGQRFLLGERRFQIHAVTEADSQGRYLVCTTQEEVAI